MTRPLAYRPEVRDEVDAAYLWYEGQRPGLGDEFLVVLGDGLEQIAQTPELYGIVHGQVRAGPLRRFPYVIYCRAEAARVVVIAVQHGRRDPGGWRSRA